ncbi:MAG: hypothetical protein LH467_02060 [Gemmatimonadaceae bacterium]|nr:hypothetical protein [Gemmatimonadaceae bacterium]
MKRIILPIARACLMSALGALAAFAVALASTYVYCTIADADCNTAGFAVLPVVAVMAGFPLMVVLSVAILLPVWRHQRRREKISARPFIAIGLLPGLLLSLVVILRGGVAPDEIMSLLVAVLFGLGVPAAAGAYTFYTIMRHAESSSS